MNKQDFILILIVALIGGGLYIVTNYINVAEVNKANVYYDNKLILTIDLSIAELRKYTVDGYNGKVVIETKQHQLRVKEEKSPLHICSKQGWVKSPYEPIVCLPNKITIKIESTDNDVDTVIR